MYENEFTPSIVLGMPDSYGLKKVIFERLIAHGFCVIDIGFADHAFKYKNVGQRLLSFYQKKIKGNKFYKSYLKYQPFEDEILVKLSSKNFFNYSLLIRADIYPENIIDILRKKTKQMVGFQWDGIERYPRIKHYIPVFDRFYVFDKNDVSIVNNCTYSTNFFTRSSLEIRCSNIPKAIFLGSYFKARNVQLFELKKYLEGMNIVCDIFIYSDNSKNVVPAEYGFKKLDSYLDYTSYLDLIEKYDIMLDIPLGMHNGMSFRPLEALGLNMKLITTNKSVIQHDFYNSNNIFILENDHYLAMKEFILGKYQQIDPTIKDYYSLDAWLSRILT